MQANAHLDTFLPSVLCTNTHCSLATSTFIFTITRLITRLRTRGRPASPSFRYVDEQLFCLRTKWTSDLASYAPYRAPFDTEFEIILNLAVGGNWPGRIVDDSIFPATMLVDYVRWGVDLFLLVCRELSQVGAAQHTRRLLQ